MDTCHSLHFLIQLPVAYACDHTADPQCFDSLSHWAIIAICAGAGVCILIPVLWWLNSRRKRKNRMEGVVNDAEKGRGLFLGAYPGQDYGAPPAFKDPIMYTGASTAYIPPQVEVSGPMDMGPTIPARAYRQI
ncbi:hypothetical protein DL96DRAFT_1709331 [Flagelloscypha sp. PMI_526]|nr:hypothetical protein DL96DRAFT_1709331 [Flagelloscypha sp. PMI_526]